MFIKRVRSAVFLLSLLTVSACGGGGGGGAVVVTPPVSSQTTVQASPTGVTTAPATVSIAPTTSTGTTETPVATVSVPTGTTMKAADGTPVTGDVKIAATYASSSLFLPATEQATIPAGQTVKGYVSINITGAGDAKVKTVNPPIPVAIAVALPDSTPVNIYSNSEGAGDTWVKEGTGTVSGGKVSFNVSHFTVYAIMQAPTTGTTGSTGTGQ